MDKKKTTATGSSSSARTGKASGRTTNAKRNHKGSGTVLGVLIVVMLLAIGGLLLVACMRTTPPETSAPDESSAAPFQESSAGEVSQFRPAPSVIELIDPDASSEDEPSDEPSDEPEVSVEVSTEVSKGDSKSETSKPAKQDQPVFNGGTVVVPITPDSPYVDIRSVTTPERNKLVTVGVDTEDPTIAEGIAKLEELYASYKKTTGFFAYSLDGKRAIAWNCENEFFSACTVKTGFILYCCLAIDQGLADKDTVMYYESKYYHGGSGYIKNCEYGTSFTIERLIYLSLNVSDNIAYEMLTAFFGHDGYNQMMADFGCERLQLGSSIWSYQMNAHDLAILWRELYFYFQSDSYMANLYRKATFNTKYNYATKSIDYDYNHKSGDSQARNPVINDGAIIWAEHPYVVAILNSSMGERADDVAVATTVKIINDYLIDGPTVSDRLSA